MKISEVIFSINESENGTIHELNRYGNLLGCSRNISLPNVCEATRSTNSLICWMFLQSADC